MTNFRNSLQRRVAVGFASVLALCGFCILLAAFSFGSVVAKNATTQLATPTPLSGILIDTGQAIQCYLVSVTPSLTPSSTPTPTTTNTPNPHPVFQTATALAQITLTQTKTPAPTWTPVEPTVESTPIPLTPTTPQPITMTVLSQTGLNVRRCNEGINPSTACSVVRVAASGTYVQATGETYEASTITWRRLTSGEWIAEIINGTRVLGQ